MYRFLDPAVLNVAKGANSAFGLPNISLQRLAGSLLSDHMTASKPCTSLKPIQPALASDSFIPHCPSIEPIATAAS